MLNLTELLAAACRSQNRRTAWSRTSGRSQSRCYQILDQELVVDHRLKNCMAIDHRVDQELPVDHKVQEQIACQQICGYMVNPFAKVFINYITCDPEQDADFY